MKNDKDETQMPTAKRLSGRQVCAAFAINAKELRDLARSGDVHPARGSDRSLQYDPAEVRAALSKGRPVALSEEHPHEGQAAATVFALFLDGKSLPEVVVAAKQAPEKVMELRRRFDAMSGLVGVPAIVASEIASALGLEKLPPVEQLSSLVRSRLTDAFAAGRKEVEDEDADYGEVIDRATGQIRKVTAR